MFTKNIKTKGGYALDDLTIYSENFYPARPLPEYPRPQMARNSYLNLNGPWQYAVTTSPVMPKQWQGDIIVPYAPPAPLSNCRHVLQPEEFLFYRRLFLIPPDFINNRVILHFGAVDQQCTVYVNRQKAGFHHGGFLPFSFDITPHLNGEVQEILLLVSDPTDSASVSCARQRLDGKGRWHTPFSGIWQTVWLESVPKEYIQSLHITPVYDERSVDITVFCNAPVSGEVSIYAMNTLVTSGSFQAGGPLRLSLSGAISWSPQNPFLYRVVVTTEEDEVESYFGMRKISIEQDSRGRPALMLNNKPFACLGVTDQGLFSDGYYTPPSDEAMKDSILFARKCGFNTIHKHGKLEPSRWYYHCDKAGMLVWQDLPAGGAGWRASFNEKLRGVPDTCEDSDYKRFGREDEDGRQYYLAEMAAAERALHNHPSLIGWTLFQRGHGQFNARDTANAMHKLDPTRLVDHAAGWYDQGGGDVFSIHLAAYRRKKDMPLPAANESRAFMVTAAGSFSLLNKADRQKLAVAGENIFFDEKSFIEAIPALYKDCLLPLVEEGLCGCFFYQLSDVLDEQDGILSYNRKTVKLQPSLLAEMNKLLGNAITGKT